MREGSGVREALIGSPYCLPHRDIETGTTRWSDSLDMALSLEALESEAFEVLFVSLFVRSVLVVGRIVSCISSIVSRVMSCF